MLKLGRPLALEFVMAQLIPMIPTKCKTYRKASTMSEIALGHILGAYLYIRLHSVYQTRLSPGTILSVLQLATHHVCFSLTSSPVSGMQILYSLSNIFSAFVDDQNS